MLFVPWLRAKPTCLKPHSSFHPNYVIAMTTTLSFRLFLVPPMAPKPKPWAAVEMMKSQSPLWCFKEVIADVSSTVETVGWCEVELSATNFRVGRRAGLSSQPFSDFGGIREAKPSLWSGPLLQSLVLMAVFWNLFVDPPNKLLQASIPLANSRWWDELSHYSSNV